MHDEQQRKESEEKVKESNEKRSLCCRYRLQPAGRRGCQDHPGIRRCHLPHRNPRWQISKGTNSHPQRTNPWKEDILFADFS